MKPYHTMEIIVPLHGELTPDMKPSPKVEKGNVSLHDGPTQEVKPYHTMEIIVSLHRELTPDMKSSPKIEKVILHYMEDLPQI